jgi:hypothetical protein
VSSDAWAVFACKRAIAAVAGLYARRAIVLVYLNVLLAVAFIPSGTVRPDPCG